MTVLEAQMDKEAIRARQRLKDERKWQVLLMMYQKLI